MKLSSIRDFLAVAERGGLRSAARHLGLSQPAITRSVRELEKELDAPLFLRTPKGVKLTDMGQAFLRRASAVQSEIQHAKDEIDQLRGGTVGQLVVCLSSVSHLVLLPNALRPFRMRYAATKLHVIEGSFPNIETALVDGSVDCYVGPAPTRVQPELHREKLFDTVRVVLGRKGHPLSGAKSLRDLVNAEWITTPISESGEESLGRMFASHGLPAPQLVMRAQSSFTFLLSLAYSDLLMMLPIQWVRFPVWRDLLQQIKVEETLSAFPVSIVHRNGLPLTPAAQYFCDMVRRAACQIADDDAVARNRDRR